MQNDCILSCQLVQAEKDNEDDDDEFIKGKGKLILKCFEYNIQIVYRIPISSFAQHQWFWGANGLVNSPCAVLQNLEMFFVTGDFDQQMQCTYSWGVLLPAEQDKG